MRIYQPQLWPFWKRYLPATRLYLARWSEGKLQLRLNSSSAASRPGRAASMLDFRSGGAWNGAWALDFRPRSTAVTITLPVARRITRRSRGLAGTFESGFWLTKV